MGNLFPLEYNNDNTASDIFEEIEQAADLNVWKPVIPFGSVKLPSFPVNELPVTVSDYVRAVAEATQTSPDMAAVASIAVLALCLQGKFKIAGKKDWNEPLNLYTAIIANPAERKSTVMKLMSAPIVTFEAEENKRLAPLIEENKIERNVLEKRRKSTEDKVAGGKADRAELRDIAEEIARFEEIKPCRLFCDDVTPEKLAGILSENDGKTAILSSEGGIFDILAGRYSENANVETFLKAHSGDSIRVDRQGRPSEYIRSPALTVLIFAQPTVIETLMSNEIFRGRGLCSRFLYSFPASLVGIRKFHSNSIAEITAENYNKLIYALLNYKNNSGGESPPIIKMSDKSSKLIQAFHDITEPAIPEELSDIMDFANRFVGTVLRIAGLIYIADTERNSVGIPDGSGEIILEESYMRSAIAIGEYFLAHAKKAYGIMRSDENQKNAEYILNKIIKNKLEKFTKDRIYQYCRKFKSADELTEPLNALVKHNYLKEIPQEYNGTGRRPQNIYSANPEIYAENADN